MTESMTSRARCLAAIRGQAVDRVPVFPLLMFFAQRRCTASYRAYATDGEALAEAQVWMHRRFGVDAVTACSDAFRISADLGGEMVYPEDYPPHLASPLVASRADLARLPRPDPAARSSRMADRVGAVAAMVRAIGDEALVLGWVDMPFAEACSLCGVQTFMLMLYEEPGLAHEILGFLTPIVTAFALAQTSAGAPMVGAGDAAASLVSPAFYREFALPYEQRVCAAVHAAGALVKLHICGNTRALLADMLQSGADLFNVDHMVPFEDACRVYGGGGKCFKGNLDPVADMLEAGPGQCWRKARACIERAAGLPYMLSAGCEVPGGTPDEVMDAFRAAADGGGDGVRFRTCEVRNAAGRKDGRHG